MFLLTSMLQVRRHLRLSMSARGIPLLVLPSGTNGHAADERHPPLLARSLACHNLT